MKHQEVCVDYWAMGKALITYAGMTVMGWIMLRLFNTVFTLPRKMRDQQNQINNTLAELQSIQFEGLVSKYSELCKAVRSGPMTALDIFNSNIRTLSLQRYPDMKITEEDLKNAEQELATIMQEDVNLRETDIGETVGKKEKPATEIGEKETGEAEATGGKMEANSSFEKEEKKSI